MEFVGKKFNLNTAEATQLGLELLATDPTDNLVEGRIYFNTTDKVIRNYNGTEWVNAGGEIEAATAAKLGGFKTTPTEGYAISENTTQSLVLVDKRYDNLSSTKEALWNIDNKPSVLALKSLGGRLISDITVEKTTDGSAWHVVANDTGMKYVFHSPNDMGVLEQTEGAYVLGLTIACPVILYRKPDAIIEVGGEKYFWFGGVVVPQSFNPQYLKANSYTYDGIMGNYFTVTDNMQSIPLYTEEIEKFIPDGTAGVQITEEGRAYVPASAGIEPATETILGGMKLKADETKTVSGYKFDFDGTSSHVYVDREPLRHSYNGPICWSLDDKPNILKVELVSDSRVTAVSVEKYTDTDSGKEYWSIALQGGTQPWVIYKGMPARETISFTEKPLGAVQLDDSDKAYVDIHEARTYELGAIKLKELESVPDVKGWQYPNGPGNQYVYTTTQCDYHQINAGADVAFWNYKPEVVACKGNEGTVTERDIDYWLSEYECSDGIKRWTVTTYPNNDTAYRAEPTQKSFNVNRAPYGAVETDGEARAFVTFRPATEEKLGSIKLMGEEEVAINTYQYWTGNADYIYTESMHDYREIDSGREIVFWNDKPNVIAYLAGSDPETGVAIPYEFIQYDCEDGVTRWTMKDPRNSNRPKYPSDGNVPRVVLKSSHMPDGAVQLRYDNAAFVDLSGCAKHKDFEFNNSSTWEVVHNLGYFPIVNVVDSEGHVALADIQHVDTNKLIVTFSEPQSGRIILG